MGCSAESIFMRCLRCLIDCYVQMASAYACPCVDLVVHLLQILLFRTPVLIEHTVERLWQKKTAVLRCSSRLRGLQPTNTMLKLPCYLESWLKLFVSSILTLPSRLTLA